MTPENSELELKLLRRIVLLLLRRQGSKKGQVVTFGRFEMDLAEQAELWIDEEHGIVDVRL